MKKVNKLLNYIEEYIAVTTLIFTSLLVFAQVVLRYLFNYSLHWSEEVARYLIIWFIFIGSSIAVREKAHATVDALVIILPNLMKKFFAILANVIAMVFCIVIILSGCKSILNVMQYGSVTPSLGMPMYIPYLAIPVGGTLMLIRFFQIFLDEIRNLRADKATISNSHEEMTKL
ncbi:TRAP transporter small permease [Lederbergia lenta]|uniref:C4-dicarboxylate transport system small permease n=1 Tax=Lederbergia lenta TaxID=1467 RepID=A0A2X4W1Z6_LEDLE|nr:TRAP transporter small permease [Lederbergia lenta]MEC2324858.1 TRAP transporter small permease [Lederbergia lenta]SQI57141.1 C4-dicarboxylate transport system small permease [Lederbergia lenta]